jgi:hypothetical protein
VDLLGIPLFHRMLCSGTTCTTERGINAVAEAVVAEEDARLRMAKDAPLRLSPEDLRAVGRDDNSSPSGIRCLANFAATLPH